jgi:hypothetical protein
MATAMTAKAIKPPVLGAEVRGDCGGDGFAGGLAIFVFVCRLLRQLA